MITESQIEQKLAEMFLNLEFAGKPEGLYDPLRYMIEIGGKRIRPRLCLTTYSLYADSFAGGICEAASALEVFHSFTLIHDDIMDNAPLRRGKETVWKKWSANTAILSGDVMCIDSYRRLAAVDRKVFPDVLGLFCDTAAGVCEGQQLDMDFEARPRVTIGEYMEMIGKKTAVLIACAAKMGALIAHAPEADCNRLFDYGYNLGLAFQIADDYLDTFGDVRTFGKSIGGDIVNGKKTWLLTKAMEKDETSVLAAMEMPVGTPARDAARIARVTELYRNAGVDEDAKYEILHYTSLALEQAAEIGLSRVKTEMLARYADKLVGRTK